MCRYPIFKFKFSRSPFFLMITTPCPLFSSTVFTTPFSAILTAPAFWMRTAHMYKILGSLQPENGNMFWAATFGPRPSEIDKTFLRHVTRLKWCVRTVVPPGKQEHVYLTLSMSTTVIILTYSSRSFTIAAPSGSNSFRVMFLAHTCLRPVVLSSY